MSSVSPLIDVVHEFDRPDTGAFLDSACVGIAPRRAVEAIGRFLTSAATCPDDSATAHHIRMDAQRAEARPWAARLIGANVDDIALVESTTHGLRIAAESIPFAAGDRVLISDLEFTEVGLVWSHLRHAGVEIDLAPSHDGRVTVDDFRAALRPETKVIAVSSVQWTNGFRCDLDAIGQLCREHGIWLVVDAVQQLGAFPLNVSETPVDMLVCGGHKWLNAPFGAGLLYIAPSARTALRPANAGYLSTEPPVGDWGAFFRTADISPLTPLRVCAGARAWELGGTGNYPGTIGLAASIRLFLEAGPERVAAHIRTLTDYLIEGLDRCGMTVVTPRAVRNRSGIVTFSGGHPDLDTMVADRLLREGIRVSMRYTNHVGGVRVSCHLFNGTGDIDRLLTVLTEHPIPA